MRNVARVSRLRLFPLTAVIAVKFIGVVLCHCSAGQVAEESDSVRTFKEFLNTNYGEYEVVYSTIQEEFPELKARVEKQPQGGPKIVIEFGKPYFYRLCKGINGFYSYSANDLASVQSFTLSTNAGQHVLGVITNSFWSLSRDTLVYDKDRAKSVEDQGKSLDVLAHESSMEVMSLGIEAQNGSFIWDGYRFTAKTPNWGKTPQDKRGLQIVSGVLEVSNGLPFLVTYSYDTNKAAIITYKYDGQFSDITHLPSKITVLEKAIAENGQTFSHYSYNLISLSTKHLPPDAGSPEPFIQANQNLKIAEKVDSETQLIKYKEFSFERRPSDRNDKRIAVLIALGILGLVPIVFLFYSKFSGRNKGE